MSGETRPHLSARCRESETGGRDSPLWTSRRPFKPAIGYALLATALLSGCTSLSGVNDDNLTMCPVTDSAKHHQPFDVSAREVLQKLINSGANTHKGSMDSTTFVRLSKQGTPLTSQHGGYDSTPWACVKDTRTDLTWEIKTNDQLLRDKHWTYTWYQPALVDKTGYAGKAHGGTCFEDNGCDTQAYVAAVNAKKLCGYDDWRLPHIFELHTLLNAKENCPGTCIDQRYFPNAAKGGYWSASPFKGFICYAWGVDFELGDASGAHKNTPLFIRLVRGKWLNSSNNFEKH